MSRTGFTVCIHRRAEALVEFGVIRPVSSSLFASLPRSVAQPSGSLHWASRDQRWARSGYEDDVGSPGPGRPAARTGEGVRVGAWENEERQLQVASTLPRTRYMVPFTAGSTWRCRVAMGEDVGEDVGPALGPSPVRYSSTARCKIRTLLLALIQCLQPQLRRGQQEAGDGSTLSWPESFQAH
jgi:hypothetical protein